jgi:Cof subfamily protein (haloacid dehalogenase superfamily)
VSADAWLVALDIDGTLLQRDGEISPAVIEQVRRLDRAGHHVMLASGRSPGATTPIAAALGIEPEYLVCSNGAVTLKRDPLHGGYRRHHVEAFSATEVLRTIRSHLMDADFAVEDVAGRYLFTAPVPETAVGLDSDQRVFVSFEDLLDVSIARLVVVSPDREVADFLSIVDRMGLRQVSYAIGWSAWLDIAAEGVNKATAVERVRQHLAIQPHRVMAVGDGHNDLELLAWAATHGRGVAMGQAPVAVLAAANETTASVQQDGLARVLATL